jgi:hypothetical protein
MARYIIAVVMAAFMSVGNVCVAQSDTTSVNDFAYVQAVHERTFNYDFRSAKVSGKQILLETRRNNGMEFGPAVGVDVFNNVFTPTLGGEVGWHGKNLGLWAGANVGVGQYNAESNRSGDTYLVTNFNLDGGVRLFDLQSNFLHQKEVWLIGSFGYKLRKDEKSAETAGYDGFSYEKVQGSSMTYGLGVKVDFKNFMKANNFYVKVMGYSGHEYYINRGRSEVKFGASLTIGFNFVTPSRHSYNEKAINKMFGSVAQYKAAMKNK